jgi:hypothetical protein
MDHTNLHKLKEQLVDQYMGSEDEEAIQSVITMDEVLSILLNSPKEPMATVGDISQDIVRLVEYSGER